MTKRIAVEMATIIEMGKADGVVASILVGGSGLNCQTMNRVIFMSPPTSDCGKIQALGLAPLQKHY
jgi:hypothetical protein